MNWMQFISSLVGSLAWPVAITFFLLRFKREVAALLPSLRKVEMPGFKAEFADEVSKVAAVVEQATGTLPSANSGVGMDVNGNLEVGNATGSTNNLLELLEPDPDKAALMANPTGVVMESWKELDATIRSIAARTSPLMDRASRNLASILHALQTANVINDDEVKSILEMQRLRNSAAHTSEAISADSAAQFAELSATLTWRFRERAARLGIWH